jgi:hypothetical protein
MIDHFWLGMKLQVVQQKSRAQEQDFMAVSHIYDRVFGYCIQLSPTLRCGTPDSFFHGLQSTKIVSGPHRAEGGPSQHVKQVVLWGVQVVGVGLA